jgi:hypothetical protein
LRAAEGGAWLKALARFCFCSPPRDAIVVSVVLTAVIKL